MAKYTQDGLFQARAYQREYRQAHKDSAAVWRLRAALNEAAKYPDRQQEVLDMLRAYPGIETGGGAAE